MLHYEWCTFFNPTSIEDLKEKMENIIADKIFLEGNKAIEYENPIAHNWEELLHLIVGE